MDNRDDVWAHGRSPRQRNQSFARAGRVRTCDCDEIRVAGNSIEQQGAGFYARHVIVTGDFGKVTKGGALVNREARVEAATVRVEMKGTVGRGSPAIPNGIGTVGRLACFG